MNISEFIAKYISSVPNCTECALKCRCRMSARLFKDFGERCDVSPLSISCVLFTPVPAESVKKKWDESAKTKGTPLPGEPSENPPKKRTGRPKKSAPAETPPMDGSGETPEERAKWMRKMTREKMREQGMA